MTRTFECVRPGAAAPSFGPPGAGTAAASPASPMIEIAPPNGAESGCAEASGLAPPSAPKLILTPPNGLALPLVDAGASSPRGWVWSVIVGIVVGLGDAC